VLVTWESARVYTNTNTVFFFFFFRFGLFVFCLLPCLTWEHVYLSRLTIALVCLFVWSVCLRSRWRFFLCLMHGRKMGKRAKFNIYFLVVCCFCWCVYYEWNMSG